MTVHLDILNEITSDVPEIELEAGITKIVGILNSKGLATLMSCEGHHEDPNKARAWVEITPSCFKHYMKTRARKMEQFLRAGEGLWFLRIDYLGRSCFRGLGSIRPRIKSMKRVVNIDMIVTIILHTRATTRNSSQKTKNMAAMEKAAQKYL